MANPFAITVASNTILLDSQRRGQTTFTVTNLLGRPLRGRARLVVQQADAAPWLAILGDAERDLPIAGTQQYGVQVTVPPTAPAGSYSFRLDIVAVDNPDELFTEGPTVSFSVPEHDGTHWPSWLLYALIGGVVVLIIGALVLYVATRPPTPTEFDGGLDIAQIGPNDTDPDVTTALVFEVEANDIKAGNNNGDGIAQIDFFIFDGDKLDYSFTATQPRYCAFGGGKPDCNQIILPGARAWPGTNNLIHSGKYVLRARAITPDHRSRQVEATIFIQIPNPPYESTVKLINRYRWRIPLAQ